MTLSFRGAKATRNLQFANNYRSLVLGMTVLAACRESGAPDRPLPAALEIVGNPIGATVGNLAGNMTVLVKDASGSPLSGVVVSFTISLGAGHVTPSADTSRADGSASAALTLGTVPGQNQVTATVSGVAAAKSAIVAGITGPNSKVAITPRALRFVANRNLDVVSAAPRDSFGNSTNSPVAWVARNPALVNITPGNGNSAGVQVLSRPGQTYLVATAGGVSDSILVSVLAASSSPCLFAAAANTLAVGGSMSLDNTGFACVLSADAGAEFVLVTSYGSPASTAIVQLQVTGNGIVAPPAASVIPPVGQQIEHAQGAAPAVAFETALRSRERSEIGPYIAGARSWFASRPAAITAIAREGDFTAVNVNAFDFCAAPDMRTARVAAITNSAVILADTSNPAGGFTDEEYRAFGAAMDTLVYPVDTTAFGAPMDIDGNGRVAILFTSAVNELTPRGSTSGVALGFFYLRDLLPRQSILGACPGSNVREMFYILVPDPGAIASDARSKSFVQGVVVSTIAHEFQHLINASRRLYVTKAPSVTDEIWLNEGLSHIAEELVFYRASNLAPRQNIGASLLQAGSETRAAFETFLFGNFGRYQQYLRAPELNSPIGSDDLLATRGATWAFLRYLADRAAPADGDLWYRIVNSQLTGVANVEAAVNETGLTVLGALRDWSISVFADDKFQSGSVDFQQPSWNFVTGMPAVGMTFGLTPAVLTNGLVRGFPLRAAGSSYMLFSVPQNQEALIQVTGAAGAPIPPGVRLMVMRTR